MEIFLQQVVSGLATGGIYGSLALALVMIYQATDVVNYAQGEMAMFSTYLAWTLINAGLPYWPAFFATLAIAFVGGLVIERVVIRPVENAPILTIVIVCIGLLVILNSLAGWIFTYTIKSFPSPFGIEPPLDIRFMSPHQLGSIGVTLLVLAALYAFFRFTPLGLTTRTMKITASATVSLSSVPMKLTYVPTRFSTTPTMRPPSTAPPGLVKPPSVAEAKA